MQHKFGCQCERCVKDDYSNTMLDRQRKTSGNQNTTTGNNNTNRQRTEIGQTFNFDADAANRANDRTQFVDENGDVKVEY